VELSRIQRTNPLIKNDTDEQEQIREEEQNKIIEQVENIIEKIDTTINELDKKCK